MKNNHMKNFKITIFAILASIGSLIAQPENNNKEDETDNREKLRFGARIGMNGSNVYDNEGDPFTADTKYGLMVGVFSAIPIGKYIGIQPEVQLSQKGFVGKGSLIGNPYSVTRTTTFLDIPIQVALKPSEFITILAGPQYSYLIKQTDKFESSNFSYEQELEFRQDNIRKNILGAVLGIDINLRHVTLSGRLAWDIQKNNGDGTQTTPRYKNKWYQVGVGFNF
jgi:hypothetical protein